jgi:alcohol dehydrogenase (NADP+)
MNENESRRPDHAARSVTLRDGEAVPALGLGTWKSEPGAVGQAVRAAIDCGYRHIDCAPIYGNEPEVGDAITDMIERGRAARKDLWITSKLWNDSHAADAVVPALERTLEDLAVDYVDLFLIHWPIAQRAGVAIPGSAGDLVPLSEVPLIETWGGMLDARRQGLARHVGVSNFSRKKLIELGALTDEPPEVVQIELHPYLQQPDLLDYCSKAGIVVTAYSPLGSPDRNPVLKAADEPDLLHDPVIAEIADDVQATPAQVLIAWALARRTSVIPKSVTPSRIAENLRAAELALDRDQLARITALDRHYRFVTGRFFELPGGPYTYESIWDEAR